jgi:hypothetical protein
MVLAKTGDWFIGFIPPGQHMLIPGQEDLVEVRIRDWPFILWGARGAVDRVSGW